MPNSEKLREGVRTAYSAAAREPEQDHPFPVGRAFAGSVGYPRDVTDSLPAAAVEAFAGVSNVAIFADIPDTATVLDLGCGAGLDTLIAAERVGPEGAVIAVDFSEPMLGRARQASAEAGISNVDFRTADAEKLPIADESVDVALLNGIFNLNPRRDEIFAELARVIRRDGAAYAAELILRGPLPSEDRDGEANWFA
ncbi:MAG: methyltransferase domain-containing protein [Candidatus Latescibacteria bacterium]|nr:methyltransferase domain-containing protein [Candidatus Latescibacterota bacterium]